MKKYLLLIALLMVVGCGADSAKDKERKVTEKALAEMAAQVGMPSIVNYQEKRLAKMIFELRDQEKLVTYAYIIAKNTGAKVFIGKCIGFGLPYSVQYTAPESLEWKTNHGYFVLPQADPNGLYMPSGLSATWLMMINPDTGKAQPVYIEPEIIVSPFKLH